MALRHVKRQLQRSEIYLGREGTAQAASFPEVRDEIVALKKLEQEQKEVALRIAQIEDALKQIEAERAENTRAQNDAIRKLEGEKKPVLQQRDDAKNAATICERELASVESRLQANDLADRELLKQLSALQAQAPPPGDLDARAAVFASKRARLPQERAEIVRAREGSAEACRQATQKLAAAEEKLSAAERNIARVRERFEATDRALNEKVRAQQDALRCARAQHQRVEERKNRVSLNIGRHLAPGGIAPPNAPHLLHDVLRHRQSVQRHNEHREQLSVLSTQIDKQELRKFYFVIVSILVLLAIVLPLVLQSPPKREWLPRETDAILSLNAERFDRDDLPKKWRNEDFWLQTWPGLIGAASQIPRLRIPGDAARVTRALTTVENSPPREFLLVEARNNVSTVVRTIAEDKQFERRTISGLPVWQQSDFSIARVGPKTRQVIWPRTSMMIRSVGYESSNPISRCSRIRPKSTVNMLIWKSASTYQKTAHAFCFNASPKLICRHPRPLQIDQPRWPASFSQSFCSVHRLFARKFRHCQPTISNGLIYEPLHRLFGLNCVTRHHRISRIMRSIRRACSRSFGRVWRED